MEAFQEGMAEIARTHPAVQHYGDFIMNEETCDRFLQGSKGNVGHAITKFKDHLAWRIEFGVDAILDEDFSDLKSHKEIYWGGVDKTGVMTLMWILRKHDPARTDAKRFVRFFVHQIECGLRSREDYPNGKFNIGIDLSEMSFSNLHDRNMWSLLQEVLANNYPKVRKGLYVWPINFWVQMSWNTVIKPVLQLLQPDIESKICPLTGDWREKLREYYDVSEIEIVYGGELDVEARSSLIENPPAESTRRCRDVEARSSLIENPPAESTRRCRHVAVPYFELPGARRQHALQPAAQQVQQADATEADESRASTSTVSRRQQTSAYVSMPQQAQRADDIEAAETRASQADTIVTLSEEALVEGECREEGELADASGDDEDNELLLPLLERESSKLTALTEISRCTTPVSMRAADGSALCDTCEDELKTSCDIHNDELLTCLLRDDRSKGMDAETEERIQEECAKTRLMTRGYRDSEKAETTEAQRLGEFAGNVVVVCVVSVTSTATAAAKTASSQALVATTILGSVASVLTGWK